MLESQNPDNSNKFDGEIRVASRIIDYLSSGLYPSPAACLKELINNSYDANASRVEVFIKPDADRIIVADDGIGLNRIEFEKHFKRISESHKRDESDETANGRPKIGKIGIGFIAANELCEVMEIYSTKAGSTELLHVSLNFEEMRKPIEMRRRSDTDVVKGDYEGEILTAGKDEHYTQLYLKSVRDRMKPIMVSEAQYSESNKRETRSLYGLLPEHIVMELKDPTLNSWSDFDAYSSTMLGVALNVPIKYYPGWIPNIYRSDLSDFEKELADLDFEVYYDGNLLGKPIVFNSSDKSALLSRFEFQGQEVAAKGYFYVQHGSIKPGDIQGLLLRIRNSAVSEYDHSFWDFTPTDSQVIQRWVSAEVWADDRLEGAMNIDRRTLRISHPAYVELRTAIHKHLRAVLQEATTKIYRAASIERKSQRENVAIEIIKTVSDKKLSLVAPIAARNLNNYLEESTGSPRIRKALQLKYSVAELYNIIIEVSNDLLSAEQLEELFKRLVERIGK